MNAAPPDGVAGWGSVFFRRFLQQISSLLGCRAVPPRVVSYLSFSALILLPVLTGTAQQGSSLSEEEKRRLFLKARENIQTTAPAQVASQGSSAAPKSNSKVLPKPKPVPVSKPVPKVAPKPAPTAPQKATPPTEASAFPQPLGSAPASGSPAPKAQAKPPIESNKPVSIQSPAPIASPKSAPSRIDSDSDAPVVIEKSGVDRKEGIQAPSFFGWFSRWKYLSSGVRREIDRAPVQKGRWRYIVVHNSGTRQGNAKAFEYYHRQVRKMQNGLAYQFVIGNGTSSGDGQVEVGSRWPKQINGGHVHSDYLNNIAIGICLVGDFNHEQPTAKQLEALDELIRYLRQRVGKTDGKWAVVKAHKEINPPRWPTDCPGNDFPYRWLHNKFD
jgi:hypothetical protein